MSTRFAPTHVAPPTGLATWQAPDASTPQGPALPADLAVEVVERRDAWALVRCSNEWQAWVDGRGLLALDGAAGIEQRAPVRLGKLTVSVPLIGGLGVVISSFLTWFGSSPLGLPSKSAYSFPVKLLTDRRAFDPNQGFFAKPGGTSIGAALLILGLAIVVLSQSRVPVIVSRCIGWLVLVMATLFVTQLQQSLGQLVVARVFSLLGMGPYVAALSGLVVGLARGAAAEPRSEEP